MQDGLAVDQAVIRSQVLNLSCALSQSSEVKVHSEHSEMFLCKSDSSRNSVGGPETSNLACD